MSDMPITALTAAGGNSRAARSMRARLQWRDRFGRWIEMGRGIKFKVRGSDGATRSVIGAFVGAKDSNVGQVYVSKDPNGLPDGFYDVTSNNAQEFVANLDESQLAERGIELGRDANGRAVGERAVEDVPNINELVRADAPEGWEAQPGTFGGKKVIQTEDGDFRIHFGGKDETVLLEDHRATPGQADPQRSVGEAFKKVTDVDMQREQSGDQAYTSLSEGNDEALASRSRDDKIEQIKANERTLANERAPLGAKQTAMDSNNQLQQELEQEGHPYDPEGNDSDEALAARKAAAPAAEPADAAAPVSTGDIDTSTFDVSPEGFLVPTGKRTNDITPEGLANFMTAEKESLGKGGARLVVDTDAGTAEIHNSADTLDNAKAQAGGLGQTSVLDLAGGKEVSLADSAVDPNSPDVNPNLDGDTSPEAPNAQDRDPNAVEPERAEPRADAPASPEPDAEAQPERTAEPSPAGDTPADPGAAPERPAGGDTQPEPRAEAPAASPEPAAAPEADRLAETERRLDKIELEARIAEIDNRIAEIDNELRERGVDPETVPAPEPETPETPEVPSTPERDEINATREELEARIAEIDERIAEIDSEIEERQAPAPEPETTEDAPDPVPVSTPAAPAAPAEPARDPSNWAADPSRPTKEDILNAPSGAILAEEHNESGDIRIYRKRDDGRWDSLGKVGGKMQPTGYSTRGDGLDSQGSMSHYASDLQGTRPISPALQQRIEERDAQLAGDPTGPRIKDADVPPGELSDGDFIRHPETDNLVRINNVSVEDFPEEGYAEYTVSYDSKNESEEDANEAAGLITLFNSDRVDTFEDWGDDSPESDAPEPDDAPEVDAEATPEASRIPETNDERLLQAAENLNRREAEYLDVLLRDDYTDEDFETAEALRDQARREFDDARNAMDREQTPAPEPTPEPVVLNETAEAPSDMALAPMLDTIEAREAEMDEAAGGGLYDQRNDPRNVSSGHENKLAALRARAMGKDLTDEQREILDQIFDSELSDADLDELNVRIDGLPNRPNTVTLARPEREQPDYMSTADVDIITAERDDPNFVFDEDLTWRRVREEFPDLEELANGDRILDENTVKGKRYQVVARRTQKNRFMVYVLETDAQGNRRAKRIGNTEWHSYEAFERRITEARKLINSKSPAGSLARRKDQPTEDLGVQGFPQDDFLGDIGNPLAPVPATGDEKFDRLLEVVATHIRNGDADLSGIEEHLQQLDPGANAINTIMNAVIGRAQDTYRPDGNNPFQMYGGEMAEVGMHFDWTDWHQELNWWLPDGSLNPNRTANPNHGLVGRGRIVGYVKENTDGKGHTYGDHVWVQMLQPDGSWGSWVKRSAQTLRQTDADAPLGQPFFSKREEWRTDPEALARRFRVPQAAPDEPVQTKERPRRDLPTSRRLRFTTRGNLAGYSNVPVPTSPNEVIRMVTTGEIQNNINRVDSLRPGMLITRLDADGNQHVDSIIRVENLGDGGYRVHAARPNGTGSADVDSFVVPGDAYIESWNSPMIPAPREAEPENRMRGELVQLDDGSRGVVAFDDGKGNLTVTTPGNETIDILESNIEVVPDAEVSGEERRDLMDSFDEYDLPDFIRQMILAGLLSPSLTRDRYNQLARTVRAFKPTSSVMRFIDRILAMIGVPRDQRRDARNYFNQ
ncbi:hypothetical protein SEA_CECE_68 [Microbacterium phage Cece]|nr:hypothetical protein SEA_CECE_68 [Microbacterium phage Cece]